MKTGSQEAANLSADAYKDHPTGEFFGGNPPDADIGGVRYLIRAHVNNPKTGYQGTVYQHPDSDEIIVAHRGTEFDREAFKDGVLTDGGMVLARANQQANDAIALTGRALAFASKLEAEGKARPEVTVTGHSLGGTLAQISAHHFGLRGETFNAYGAASLGLRIPEGGNAVTNHVMAGDAVSAASPHYGQVKVYALPAEVRALSDKGFDNERHWSDVLRGRSPVHYATGMTPPGTISAAVALGGSHSMHHFVDLDGQGLPNVSVLRDPQAKALAQQHAVAIDEYRQDVRGKRAVITAVARGLGGGALMDGIDALRGPLDPGEPARLSPVSRQLLHDSHRHVRELSEKHGLPWDQGMENTACAVARCARDHDMNGISHLRVGDGQIHLAQWDGQRLDEAQIDALRAANTPAGQSLQGLLANDARAPDPVQPVQQAQFERQEAGALTR